MATADIGIAELSQLAGVPEDIIAEYMFRPNKLLYRKAVEHAVNNRRLEEVQVLNEIVAYYLTTERIANLNDVVNEFQSPLIIIVQLASDIYYEGKLISLPTIVKRMIDAGVKVNIYDMYRYTALDNLMRDVALTYCCTVRLKVNNELNLAMKVHEEMVDTARLLIEAGLRTDADLVECSLFLLFTKIKELLRFIIIGHLFTSDYHIEMLVELVNLFFANNPVTAVNDDRYSDFLRSLLKFGAFLANRYEKDFQLNGFEKIFRCLIANGANLLTSDVDWSDTISMTYPHNLVSGIIIIAGLSSTSENLYKLMTYVMHAMSVNQVLKLKESISTQLNAMNTSERDGVRSKLLAIRALECIGNVEVPYQLQHLARLVINRSLTGGRLPRAFDKLGMGLPSKITKYLAYEY